jgi:hypothetical protein
VLLAYPGLHWSLAGIALWPSVVLHAVLRSGVSSAYGGGGKNCQPTAHRHEDLSIIDIDSKSAILLVLTFLLMSDAREGHPDQPAMAARTGLRIGGFSATIRA